MKTFQMILIFLLSIFTLSVIQAEIVLADAKVDGFFKENLVKEGFFQDSSIEKLNKSPRPSFFISREERRQDPAKAPSNNIQLPQHSIRVRSRTVGFPTPWGQSVYSSGILLSQ